MRVLTATRNSGLNASTPAAVLYFVFGTWLGVSNGDRSGVLMLFASDRWYIDQPTNVTILAVDLPSDIGHIPVHLQMNVKGAVGYNAVQRVTKTVHIESEKQTNVELLVKSTDLPSNTLHLTVKASIVDQKQKLHFRHGHAEAHVLLDTRNSIVFIELDKPMYTPKQEVKLRVYTVGLNLKPQTIPFILQILNPQDIMIKGYTVGPSTANYTKLGIFSTTYKFGNYPKLGRWTAKVLYGYQNYESVSEHFDVDEYVLPAFEVIVTIPSVILPKTETLPICVNARYTFSSTDTDKSEPRLVNGSAKLLFGVHNVNNVNSFLFTNITPEIQLNGSQLANKDGYCYNLNLSIFFNTNKDKYRELEGSRLFVNCTVEDSSSGLRHTVNNTNAVFSSYPYLINFDDTPNYFTPGFFTITICTIFPNNRTKPHGKVLLSAYAFDKAGGNDTILLRHSYKTDDHGMLYVTLTIPPSTIKVQLIAVGNEESQNQSVQPQTELTITAYSSESNDYIRLRIKDKKYKVGDELEADVVLTLTRLIQQYHYIVLSRGQIITAGSENLLNDSTTAILRLHVTQNMIPKARILVYATVGNQLVTESALVYVDNSCKNNELELNVRPTPFLPGDNVTVEVRPRPQAVLDWTGAQVATVAVDKSVYLLRDKTYLSTQQFQSTLSQFDNGCSNGGGRNNTGVLQDIGVTTKSNFYSVLVPVRHISQCTTQIQSRKRRSAEVFNGNDLEDCCKYGVGTASLKRSKHFCTMAAFNVNGKTSECKNKIHVCCTGYLKNSSLYEKFLTAPIMTDRVLTTTLSMIDVPEGSQRQAPQGRQQQKESYVPLYSKEAGSSLSSKDAVAPGLSGPAGSRDPVKVAEEEEEDDFLNDDGSDFSDFESIEFFDTADSPARKNFPESFLFTILDMDHSNQWGNRYAATQVTLPDTITTWVVQATAVHPDHGMCVGINHNFTVTKNFFIKLHLPYQAKKTEELEVKATIYNNFERPIRIAAILDVPKNVCSKFSLFQHSKLELTVAGLSSQSVTWPIVPLATGDYNITVSAYYKWIRPGESYNKKQVDKIQKVLYVVPPGVIKNVTTTLLLDPTRSQQFTEDVQNDSPSADIVTTQIVSNRQELHINMSKLLSQVKDAVPGTVSCDLDISADIMSPVVSKVLSNEGLENLWGVPSPSACGEQTISALAPTLMAAKYLKHSKGYTPVVEEIANRYIGEGIVRQLAYRDADGSFKFWQHDDNAKSTWLTALVVTVLHFTAKNRFNISQHLSETQLDQLICSASFWLAVRQDEHGEFQEPFLQAYQRFYLVGGLQTRQALTAHVLISLLHAQCSEMPKVELAVKNAVTYLERHMRGEIIDHFTLAISTYALTLYNSSAAGEALRKLEKISIFDTGMKLRFWSEYDLQQVYGQTNVHNWQTSWWKYHKSAIAVQTTAYALLAYLEAGNISMSEPIANWLLYQRNSYGAFISTYDTFVGLWALTAFRILTSSRVTDLRITISDSVQTRPLRQLHLHNSVHHWRPERVSFNYEDLHNRIIRLSTEGLGQAQAVLTLRYHQKVEDVNINNASTVPVNGQVGAQVEKVTELSNPCSEFDLQIITSAITPNSIDQLFKAKICVKSLKSEEGGMAMIEISLPTGFGVEEDSLKQLQEDRVGGVNKYEITSTDFNLYLDHFPRDNPVCLDFLVHKVHKVKNLLPGTVKVYHYYSPTEDCVKPLNFEPKQKRNKRNVASSSVRYSCEPSGQCECKYDG